MEMRAKPLVLEAYHVPDAYAKVGDLKPNAPDWIVRAMNTPGWKDGAIFNDYSFGLLCVRFNGVDIELYSSDYIIRNVDNTLSVLPAVTFTAHYDIL